MALSREDIEKILFPENIKQKVVGCFLLLLFTNGIVFCILKEITWPHSLQYYLPISIIALFVQITYYLVYDFRRHVLCLWYFWPFPVMPFIIGVFAFYLIPNWLIKPHEPPKNLLVVIANFEPIPGGDEDAKTHSETVPADLERMIIEKRESGVPLEFPILLKQVIEGETEEEKRKNAKEIGIRKGAHLVLWGSVQFTKLGDEGEFYLKPKITVVQPLGPTKLEEKQPDGLRVSLSEPESFELRRRKIEETVDILCGLSLYAKKDEQGYQRAINFFRAIENPGPKISFYEGMARKHLRPSIIGEVKKIPVKEIIEQFDKVIGLRPQYAEVLKNEGIILYNSGKYEEAVALYNMAIKMDPLSVAVWNNNGLALDKLGNHEDAIYCFDKAIEINPQDPEVWSYKGVTLFNLNKYEEAITCFDKAIELDSKLTEAWSNKGDALNKLGKHEDAITHCDAAIKINPQYAPAWYNKAEALGMLGRLREAIEAYQNFIKFASPQDAEYVRQAKEQIRELQGKIEQK